MVLYFATMASTVPLVREYAFVVLHMKMSNATTALTSSAVYCRYGETNDVFPIGGLVRIGETPIAAGSRYCRQLVNFQLKSPEQLCLFKVIDGVMDSMPARISLFILDFKVGALSTLYRTQYCASQLANVVDALRDHTLDDVDDYVFPPPVISTTVWGKKDKAIVHNWTDAVDKTLCFDFGILITVKGIDTPIASQQFDGFTMRNSIELNGIWSEVIKALRLRISDSDLRYNWKVGSALTVALPTSTNAVATRPTLPLCFGETDEIIDDHWVKSKTSIIDAGINVNSREAVCILVDSFAGKLGRWASDNAELINELRTVSTLGAFLDVSYAVKENEGVGYFHLRSLLELKQKTRSLQQYTKEFNCSYGFCENDISFKAAANKFIEGITSLSLTEKLWSNWTNGKYANLLDLQNDAFEINTSINI